MNPSKPPGMLGKLIGFMFMAVMLVIGLMFSAVLLGVVLVFGLAAFGYFWWKTRDLRKAMKEQAAAQAKAQGTVIEGDATVVEETESVKTGMIAEKVGSRND